MQNALLNAGAVQPASQSTAAPATTVAPAPAVAAAPAIAKKVATPAPTVAKKVPAPKETKPKLDVGEAIANAATGSLQVQAVQAAPKLPPMVHVGEVEQPNENPEEPTPTKTVVTLEVFGSGCLECRALVDDNELPALKTLPPCHFSMQGQHCPAEHVKIVSIPEWRLFADRLVSARNAMMAGNPVRYTKQMAKLSEMPAEFQSKVLAKLGMIPA